MIFLTLILQPLFSAGGRCRGVGIQRKVLLEQRLNMVLRVGSGFVSIRAGLDLSKNYANDQLVKLPARVPLQTYPLTGRSPIVQIVPE